MLELEGLLSRLQDPVESSVGGTLAFQALQIPGWPAYQIGRGSDGGVALLVEIADRSVTPPGIELQSLVIYHNALCRVSGLQSDTEERLFTVLSYTGRDPDVRAYFVRLLAPLIESLGQHPKARALGEAIDAIAELFRSLVKPPRKSTQGLWSELLVLAHATHTELLARSWHAFPGDRFDFNAGEQRLEIKSCSGTVRRHHFALEQVRPPLDVRVIVASVIATRATGGASVQQLMERVLEKLGRTPSLQAHVYRVVAETLGNQLAVGLADAFDEQLAVHSCAYVRADDIPACDVLSPFVSEVRFVADLSAVPAMSRTLVHDAGGLFAAI
jgi:hypothetical protein